MKKNQITPQYIAVTAMFAALAFISVAVSEVIPKVQGFLSYEPKDAIIVIAGFLFGPLSGVIISLLVSFIEMITISSTGPIGFLMNVIASCSFVLPPAILYSKSRTKKSAVLGLVFGVICMTVSMLLWNYSITPLYMGVERKVVAGMLLSVFLPFNLVKGGINACITLILYKPVVTVLRNAHLVKPSEENEGKPKYSAGFFAIAAAVLVTFVISYLALTGVI